MTPWEILKSSLVVATVKPGVCIGSRDEPLVALGESAGLTRRVTRKRVPRGPCKRTLEYVEEADRVQLRQAG